MGLELPTDNQESAAEPVEVPFEDVEDPEGLNRQLRLRALHDAQQEYIDVRNQVELYRLEGGLGENEGRHMVRTALENYLMLAEPVITASDEGTEYWNSVEIGTFTISPPEEFREEVNSAGDTVNEDLAPVPFSVVGLGTILEAPSPCRANFTAEVVERHRGTQTKSVTETEELPFHILKTAFRKTNMFLREVGIELKPGGGRPFANYGER